MANIPPNHQFIPPNGQQPPVRPGENFGNPAANGPNGQPVQHEYYGQYAPPMGQYAPPMGHPYPNPQNGHGYFVPMMMPGQYPVPPNGYHHPMMYTGQYGSFQPPPYNPYQQIPPQFMSAHPRASPMASAHQGPPPGLAVNQEISGLPVPSNLPIVAAHTPVAVAAPADLLVQTAPTTPAVAAVQVAQEIQASPVAPVIAAPMMPVAPAPVAIVPKTEPVQPSPVLSSMPLLQAAPVAQVMQAAQASPVPSETEAVPFASAASEAVTVPVMPVAPVVLDAQTSSAAPLAQLTPAAPVAPIVPVTQEAPVALDAQTFSAAPLSQFTPTAPAAPIVPVAQQAPVASEAETTPVPVAPVALDAQPSSLPPLMQSAPLARVTPAAPAAPVVSVAQQAPVAQEASAADVSAIEEVSNPIDLVENLTSSPHDVAGPSSMNAQSQPAVEDVKMEVEDDDDCIVVAVVNRNPNVVGMQAADQIKTDEQVETPNPSAPISPSTSNDLPLISSPRDLDDETATEVVEEDVRMPTAAKRETVSSETQTDAPVAQTDAPEAQTDAPEAQIDLRAVLHQIESRSEDETSKDTVNIELAMLIALNHKYQGGQKRSTVKTKIEKVKKRKSEAASHVEEPKKKKVAKEKYYDPEEGSPDITQAHLLQRYDSMNSETSPKLGQSTSASGSPRECESDEPEVKVVQRKKISILSKPSESPENDTVARWKADDSQSEEEPDYYSTKSKKKKNSKPTKTQRETSKSNKEKEVKKAILDEDRKQFKDDVLTFTLVSEMNFAIKEIRKQKLDSHTERMVNNVEKFLHGKYNEDHQKYFKCVIDENVKFHDEEDYRGLTGYISGHVLKKASGKPRPSTFRKTGRGNDGKYHCPNHFIINPLHVPTSITWEELKRAVEKSIGPANTVNHVFADLKSFQLATANESVAEKDRKMLRDQYNYFELDHLEGSKKHILPVSEIKFENNETFLKNLERIVTQAPITNITNIGSVLGIDTSKFLMETIVECNPDLIMDAQFQNPQPHFRNHNDDNVPSWKSQGEPDQWTTATFLEYYQEREAGAKKMLDEMMKSKARSRTFEKLGKDYKEYHSKIEQFGADYLNVFGTNIDLQCSTGKFDEQVKEVAKFPHFLRPAFMNNMLNLVGEDVLGINTIQMYCKTPNCRTAAHMENSYLGSVNWNIGPGTCIWYAVPMEYSSKIDQCLKDRRLDFQAQTDWPEENVLLSKGIPVIKFRQEPDQMVYVNTGTYHWVQSEGFTVNVSYNIAPISFFQIGTSLAVQHHNVLNGFECHIPMTKLAWTIADRQLYTDDERICEAIRGVLIRSLSHNMMFVAEIKGLGYEPIKQDQLDFATSNILRCGACKSEIFNVAKWYVDSINPPEENKTFAYCHMCTVRPPETNKPEFRSILYSQKFDFEELGKIMDEYKYNPNAPPRRTPSEQEQLDFYYEADKNAVLGRLF